MTHLLDRVQDDEPSGHEVGDDHVGIVVRVRHPVEESGRVVGEELAHRARDGGAEVVRLDAVPHPSSNRPSGRRTRAASANARTRDGKNMAPNWHTTTSND